MRESRFLSNKSLVAIKVSLFAAVLIGLVVFAVSLWPVYAGGDECPDVQTLGEVQTGCIPADCDDGNPCTDDKCVCNTYCEHDNNDYQEEESCGSGDCVGTRTRTCSDGSFGPWSDCSTYGDYCGDCVLVNCHIDDNPFTADLLLSGSMACDEEGYCTDEECVYGHYCADKWTDDGSYPTVSCNAPCDQDEDCGDYCEGDTVKIGTCNNEGDNPPCTCSWSTENCADLNGWEDTGEKRWVETGQCTEKEQKEQEYREYTCVENEGAECTDAVTDTQWVDTGNTRNKDDGTTCDDGNLCTVDDECTAGVCGGTTKDCSDLDDQCQEGICDPSDGQCYPDYYDYSESCEADGDLCTIDYCDGSGGCVKDYDTDCSYLNNGCQEGACDPSNGKCYADYFELSTHCDNGLWCDGPDHCDGYGSCINIGPPPCDDEDECTYDICDETADQCQNPHKDEEAPVTTKTYGIPRYPDDEYHAEWITSQTPITLTAVDTGICAIDNEIIYYMNTLVEDCYCEDPETYCVPIHDYSDQGWIEYIEPFTKPEESCHMIEYWSVDELDNKETIKVQCVFVDNSAPEPIKEVGRPKAKWDGKDNKYYPGIEDLCWNGQEDEIECWRVTTETHILMNCTDPEPHPVGVKELCYKVDLDAEDATEQYCSEELDEGWCCIEDSIKEIVFEEDSEHELEFYCVDELDQVSPIDIEKFKVEGEEFEIELNEKWNLISVPFVLLSSDPKDVFEDIKEEVLLVLTYDPDECADDGWCIFIPDTGVGTITEIKPGWGYWVLAKEHTYLTVVGTPWSPGETAPPSRSVEEGWNLIGYYGTDEKTYYHGPDGIGKQAFCVLHSLSYPTYKWSALYSYWKPIGDIELNECDLMYPGAGYWIGMNQADPNYFQSTVCTGNPCV